MCHNMTKPTKWPVCAQRRLGSAWASAQSDQSSLCAHWVAKDIMFLHADAQADLSLRWADMPYCWFCRDAAHITNCLHTIYYYLHNNIYCPGQNMQQTFLKFVEIYFCLCQKCKTGVLHGKNRNQGKSFLPKNTIAYQNTLLKQSTRTCY